MAQVRSDIKIDINIGAAGEQCELDLEYQKTKSDFGD